MKTKIFSYRFDLRNADEKAAYAAFVTERKAAGSSVFRTWGGKGSHWLAWAVGGRDITLETNHVFDNQWSTAPIEGVSTSGYRVFDWAEDYPIDFDKRIKRGHYLVITDEMREVRCSTVACGYCGKQEPAEKGYTFCPHCLGSAYLGEDSLHLTRMQSVASKNDRAPLSDAEKAYLLPVWKDAQLKGNRERSVKAAQKRRAEAEEKYKKAIARAAAEHSGMIWLCDNGINPDNVIYYDHTDVFSFGWRKPIDASLVPDLLAVLADFPATYEIKCADGKTLQNKG